MALNKIKAYDIVFSGLKEGVHVFDYLVTNDFLETLPSEHLVSVNANVKIQLEKQKRMLILDFEIRGLVNVLCDRCLDPLDLPLKGKERLIVKFGEESYEETEDIVVLPETAYQINVAQYIFEFLHLLLPIRRIHGEDKDGKSLCDPDMVKRLAEILQKAAGDLTLESLKSMNKDI